MKKKELIKLLAKNTKNTEKVVKEVIEEFTKQIELSILDREPIYIPNIGYLKPKLLKERKCKNVFSGGKMITIPEKKTVKFQLSDGIKTKLNK
jgi:nucleoid DNA-binding protein